MLPPKEDVIEYYNNLKTKGYKIYLCSNITEDTYNYIKNNFNIVQNADGEICSCFEHVSKPNVKIYNSLINKYNINPEESIFIDDTKKNIEIAEKLQFNTILFKELEQLKIIN